MVCGMETLKDALAATPYRALVAAAGVSSQSAHAWKSGQSLPGPKHIPAVAKVLGRPVAEVRALIAAEAGRRFVEGQA